MGIDYSVYYGPYIEVKTTGLKRTVDYQYNACNNPNCGKYLKAQANAKFCSTCGALIEVVHEQIEEEWDAFEMAEEMGILDELSPERSNDENGDTEVFYPSHDSIKSGSKSLKYETLWKDLSDLDIKEEIEKTKECCAKSLDILEKVYGVKPVVKWGVIGSVG